MTLKELRIKKGLTQSECAKIFNMTTRNYQNYENDESKINTVRYKLIYNQLENYSLNNTSSIITSPTNFNTNVIIGTAIKSLYKSVLKYNKRNCFNLLKKYINGEYNGKVCILYGLKKQVKKQ